RGGGGARRPRRLPRPRPSGGRRVFRQRRCRASSSWPAGPTRRGSGRARSSSERWGSDGEAIAPGFRKGSGGGRPVEGLQVVRQEMLAQGGEAPRVQEQGLLREGAAADATPARMT